jgi:hypothetical protein
MSSPTTTVMVKPRTAQPIVTEQFMLEPQTKTGTSSMRRATLMHRLVKVTATLLVANVLACGGRLEGMNFGPGGGDTSTDFLRACDDNSPCGEEFACDCGVCTLPCKRDADCRRTGVASSICVSTPTCGTPAICATEEYARVQASTILPDSGEISEAPMASEALEITPTASGEQSTAEQSTAEQSTAEPSTAADPNRASAVGQWRRSD